ncbi:CHASE2 domain-containing protein [Cupriavidus respiraculi]|uniref:histidine kinase n=1 Tax=Cupriavidus respiraculi TaxID=195930 RepID=A0ABN7YRL3_9BURK|nr:CHASE2 domain-containing protein [Cupriavidus respiraculi]CAG9174961.1 Adaptive-response sensory-kinase SasA [Cupriavidus respiraculi]
MTAKWRGGGSAARPARQHRLFGGYRQRTLCEWLVLTAAVIALAVAAAVLQWGQRAHLAVYDMAIAAQQHPARDDIVIVGIDDESLATIGRWPWRRAVLADLVDRVAAGGPRVIGLDVLLSEPDARNPADDRALADSMARAGNVVLPALAEPVDGGYDVRYPLPQFAERAGERIGHINITLDADGLARHIFLREGPPGEQLDHLVLRMAEFGRPAGERRAYRHEPRCVERIGHWQRAGRLRIPFAGPPGTFQTVSAAAVLQGGLDPAIFRGKYVLVGALATGMGDMFAAPLSRHGAGIPGVELMANALQALLDGTGIVALPAGWFWAATLAAVLLVAIGGLVLSPRSALLVGALLVALLLFASLMLMRGAQLWFDPVPGALGCLVFYPLWSWRRQESALAFLADEAARLEQEPTLPATGNAAVHGKSLDARMGALYRLTTRLRDLRQFLADGLSSLPDATLICDLQGRVLLANERSAALAPRAMARLDAAGEGGPDVRDVIGEVFMLPRAGLDFWARLRHACLSTGPGAAPPPEFDGVELIARDQRPMLLRGAPLRTDGGGVAGLAISFVDITQARVAERRREEMLRFISHDMRSPQASILALVELQSDPAKAIDSEVLLERIRHHAARTLELADDFISLARAESQALRFVETDLSSVVMDATDELWALANARRITLDLTIDDGDMAMRAEPGLLMRAVANLLDNAIKFSADGGKVRVRVRRDAQALVVEVVDQGPGIAPEDQARLFQPFSRLRGDGRHAPQGSGLGLLFVRTVVERHGGRVGLTSSPGAGANFSMVFPLDAVHP